jgi:hypothetical protein
MQGLHDDYLSAYRSLKLTRDADKSMQAKSEPVVQRGKIA